MYDWITEFKMKMKNSSSLKLTLDENNKILKGTCYIRKKNAQIDENITPLFHRYNNSNNDLCWKFWTSFRPVYVTLWTCNWQIHGIRREINKFVKLSMLLTSSWICQWEWAESSISWNGCPISWNCRESVDASEIPSIEKGW